MNRTVGKWKRQYSVDPLGNEYDANVFEGNIGFSQNCTKYDYEHRSSVILYFRSYQPSEMSFESVTDMQRSYGHRFSVFPANTRQISKVPQ